MTGFELKEIINDSGIKLSEILDKSGIPQRTLYNIFNKEKVEKHYLDKLAFLLPKNAIVKNGLPVYDAPASASDIMMYQDFEQTKPIGFINLQGYEDCKFAIPVWGQSMYPTFKSGMFAICKEIKNKTSIVYGECYYIEWDDYRMVKRLLVGDHEDEIILWSDNDKEILRNKPKYAPIKIKIDNIRGLYLIKGVAERYHF